MKNTLKTIFLLLIAFSIGLNVYFLTRKDHETVKRTIVRTVKIDTIRDTVPQLVSTTYLKTKYDTLVMKEVIPGDTVRVVAEVPIEQKVFEKDSVYRAWVSGYDANLDSLKIYYKTITVKETVDHYFKDNKRFGIGPYVGAGYQFNNKQWGWGVGISLQYNFIKF